LIYIYTIDCYSQVCNTKPIDCFSRGRLLYRVNKNDFVTTNTISLYEDNDNLDKNPRIMLLCYDDLFYSTFGIRQDIMSGTKCGSLRNRYQILECCHFCHSQMENILLPWRVESLKMNSKVNDKGEYFNIHNKRFRYDEKATEDPYDAQQRENQALLYGGD